MSAIDVIRTLQEDYAQSADTILAVMIDYIDARCHVEDFSEFMLNNLVPEDDEDDEK